MYCLTYAIDRCIKPNTNKIILNSFPFLKNIEKNEINAIDKYKTDRKGNKDCQHEVFVQVFVNSLMNNELNTL
jgi:hypothetical protein